MKVILVPGTLAAQKDRDTPDWWQEGSPLIDFLHEATFSVTGMGRPWWSTDIDGIRGPNADWMAGGMALYTYLVPPLCPDRRMPPEETRVIAHSHGGQVALYAAAYGLKIRSLITIASPIRKDMQKIIAAARPNIGHWLHIHSDKSDWMQMLGGLFDRRIGVYRRMPRADVNLLLPNVGHSKVLHENIHYTWDIIAKSLQQGG